MQIYPLSVGVNNDHLLVPEVADDLGIEGEGPEEEVEPAHAEVQVAQPDHPQHPVQCTPTIFFLGQEQSISQHSGTPTNLSRDKSNQSTNTLVHPPFFLRVNQSTNAIVHTHHSSHETRAINQPTL